MFTMIMVLSIELTAGQVKPPEPSPPPPLKPPLRVEIVGNTNAMVRVLQVYDAGEFHRPDFG